MPNETIALHFSNPETTVVGSPLNGLARELSARSTTAMVDFVLCHVLQPHVVSWTNVDLTFQLLSTLSIVECGVACCAESSPRQHLAVFHNLLTLVLKRRAVAKVAVLHRYSPHQRLYQLTDGHPTGQCVRVDNDVRTCAVFQERHVLFVDDQPGGSLLSTPTAHLVTLRWCPPLSHPHLGDPEPVFAF